MISCFIVNGINLARHPSGTCTILATVAKEDPNRPNTFGVRFAVKDDGDGLNSMTSSSSQTWTASDQRMSPISLHLFKKIVDAHGGVIGVDSKPGKGSCFFFEIYYPLPTEAAPVVEVLNKNKLRKLSAAEQAAKLARTSVPVVPLTKMPAQLAAIQSARAEKYRQSTEKVERSVSPIKASTYSAQEKYLEMTSSRPDEKPRPTGGIVKQFSGEHPLIINLFKSLQGTALIVDDVISNRRMTGRVLEQMGFEVDQAEDGKIAVEMCTNKLQKDGPYSLIIMDNMMPVMTGKEATEVLRSMNYNGLIVGLTGNILEEDLEEFSKSGCNEVITKPLDVPELRRTLISLGLSVPSKSVRPANADTV